MPFVAQPFCSSPGIAAQVHLRRLSWAGETKNLWPHSQSGFVLVVQWDQQDLRLPSHSLAVLVGCLQALGKQMAPGYKQNSELGGHQNVL